MSVKGLAKFMTARHAAQRKVLHDFKYPDPEGHAQAGYYREALAVIAAYHREKRDEAWLDSQALVLSSAAAKLPVRARIRLSHNARAVAQYARHFAHATWLLDSAPKLALTFGGVRVSVQPDFSVEENGKQRLVKMELTAEKKDTRDALEVRAERMNIIAQCLFEAARANGIQLPVSGIAVLDVPLGVTHKGARLGARMAKEIKAACANIEALWNAI